MHSSIISKSRKYTFEPGAPLLWFLSTNEFITKLAVGKAQNV